MNQQVREIISYLDIQIRAKEKILKEHKDEVNYNYHMPQKQMLEQVKNWILKELR